MVKNHKYFHWFYYHQRKNHWFNVGTGFFIWLFLGLTLPFGVYNNNFDSYPNLLLFLLPFGLVWTLIAYSTDNIVSRIFHIKIHENHLIDFKIYFIKLFLLVHAYFTIRNYFCDWLCFDLLEYFELWFACVLMLSLVYIPFSIYAKYKYFHKMIGVDRNRPDDLFEFKGEGKAPLILPLNSIIYIKSDDNYVDIMTVNKDDVQKTIVFRARLKSLADQLKAHSQFIKVHRSFIVNLQYLYNSDKSESIKLKRGDLEFEIPISKKYRDTLKTTIR